MRSVVLQILNSVKIRYFRRRIVAIGTRKETIAAPVCVNLIYFMK
jgi:hypothetical protein